MFRQFVYFQPRLTIPFTRKNVTTGFLYEKAVSGPLLVISKDTYRRDAANLLGGHCPP
jgi:hypothetical protein